MSCVKLALNVDDVDAEVDFYSKLFKTKSTKCRQGYANFAISNPPLKLVLIENNSAAERLNHLGIEVESSEQVSEVSDRLKQSDLSIKPENQVTCCYALQDKVWVKDPDGADWEVYVVLEDSATFGASQKAPAQTCCT